MIQGHAQRRVDRDAWEIALYDQSFSYTLEITKHKLKQGLAFPTTLISRHEMTPLLGLAKAMIEMGILKDDATTAELKATKYHLEDMRKLTFKGEIK